jgi:hypothetical protein
MIQKNTTIATAVLSSDHHCTPYEKQPRNLTNKSTYRCNQRTSDKTNHTPIERQNAHAQTGIRPKQRIHNHAIRCSPADPVEHTQRRKQIPRKPIPQECADHNEKEEPLSRHVVPFADAVVLVESVEEGGVYKCTGPDHRSRPNDKLSQHPTKGKAQHLRSQRDQDLVREGQLLVIKDPLGGDDVRRVGASDGDVGHDGDADVFFDRERAGVEGPDDTEGFEFTGGEDAFQAFAEGQGEKLDHDAGDDDRRDWKGMMSARELGRQKGKNKRTAHGEDLVEAGYEDAKEDTKEPPCT